MEARRLRLRFAKAVIQEPQRLDVHRHGVPRELRRERFDLGGLGPFNRAKRLHQRQLPVVIAVDVHRIQEVRLRMFERDVLQPEVDR